MELTKRAIFYTLDALILMALLLSAIVFIDFPTEQPSSALPTSYLARDLLLILSELEVHELNNTWVEDQIQADLLDPNATILIQLGELWADDNLALANNLTAAVFSNVSTSQTYGLWIGDEQIYISQNSSSLDPSVNTAVRSWRVISGIEKAKPFKGHVASARATDIIANGTRTITISPQGSGWEDGEGFITKYVDLGNISVSNAQLRLSVHADVGDVWATVNNCSFVYADFTWLFGTEGNVGYTDATSCMKTDWNNITLELNNDAYNAHTHPGTQLVLSYSSEVSDTIQSTSVSQRYYFDNTLSDEDNGDGSGAWQTVPFYIPSDATDVSVSLQVVGRSVRDYDYPANNGCDIHVYPSSWTYCNTFRDWNNNWAYAEDYDYMLFVNSDTPFDVDATPTTNVQYNYDMAALSGNLINGSNLVTVYFNNYGDYVWGDGDTIIYSNPITDPSGSSYVEVNYTDTSLPPLGLIEISQVAEFGGVDDEDKQTSFSYPSQAQEKGVFAINTIQQYSFLVTAWADTSNPPLTEVFRSPASRAVPSEIFVDSSVFDLDDAVTNYVRAADDNTGNDILGISSIEYSFYIPSFVGFGDVFQTQAAAQADAVSRLGSIMSGYISSDSIVVQNQSVTNVSTLWGPIVVEVRAWK